MILTAPSVQPSDEDFRVDDSYEDTWTSEQVSPCPSLYFSLLLSLLFSLSLALFLAPGGGRPPLDMSVAWRFACLSLCSLHVCHFAVCVSVDLRSACLSTWGLRVCQFAVCVSVNLRCALVTDVSPFEMKRLGVRRVGFRLDQRVRLRCWEALDHPLPREQGTN